MNGEINYADTKRWERFQSSEAAGIVSSGNLEVRVIFTDPRGTIAALKTAGTLAAGLGASIKLIAAQAVPYAYPLDRPPVNIGFTERLLSETCHQVQGALETTVRLYFCRNRVETLLRVLAPNSLVVIGGRKGWWPTAERRLARTLRSKGHQVVFARY